MSETLYEHDFVTWTENQAEALRAAKAEGTNLPLDWELLAEEIEDLGKGVRNKVRSLALQIQIHLLKIACSTAVDQRPHWMSEVDGFRRDLTDELADNHALRARFAEISISQTVRAVKDVRRTLRHFGEEASLPALSDWAERGISAQEVLAEGAYPEPGTQTFRFDD